MTRINVYSVSQDAYGNSEPGELAGWFDPDKAERFPEDTVWDGSNHISVQTGSQWDHETLLHTAGGRWVLRIHSNRQGTLDSYKFVTDTAAREWLLRNNDDAAVAEFFGPIEEERGPGRPEVGPKVQVRLPDELLGRLDAYAAGRSATRAEAVRILLGEALTEAQPYTVTIRDISTGVREVRSRHATLGAAVEALREEQAYDAEDNGLPSWQPRVEHDGRPVDVEAMSD